MKFKFISSLSLLLFALPVFSQDTIYIRNVHEAIRKGTFFMGASVKTVGLNISQTEGNKTLGFDFMFLPRLGVFIDNMFAIGGTLVPSHYNNRSGDESTYYLFGGFARYYVNENSPSWFIDFGFAMNHKEYDFSEDSLGYHIETIDKQRIFNMGLGYSWFGEHITLEGSLNLQYADLNSIDWNKMINQPPSLEMKNNQVISLQPYIGFHFYF